MESRVVQMKQRELFTRGWGQALLLSMVVLLLVSQSTVFAKQKQTEHGKTERGKTERQPRVVRVVIIGGMVQTTDMWFAVADKFEEKTGYKVELVKGGTVDVISKWFEAGTADLLTMHSTDTTTNLVADGYGVNMRPWVHNDVVIMGPEDDPAGIAGMTDGVEAFAKIVEAGERGEALFVDLWGIGKRELGQTIWERVGIEPVNEPWFVKDSSDNKKKQLTYVASLGNAYCLFGRVPIIKKKNNTGGLKIMVEGDPMMRRPYIVMEANPRKFPEANFVGARKLSNFLLSKEIQDFLPTYQVEEFEGIPPYHPLRNKAFWNDAEPMILDLIDFLISLDLHSSVSQPLEVKLDQALAVLINNDIRDDSRAIFSLTSFNRKLNTMKGVQIDAETANVLIEQAEMIIEVLQAESE